MKEPSAEADTGLAEIRTQLKEYARKDVFRKLKEEATNTNSQTAFSFYWLSRDNRIRLIYDSAAQNLEFEDLFQDIPAHVEQYVEEFVRQRQTHEGIPDHKKIDSEKAKLEYRKGKGNGSIALQVKQIGAHAYCVKKLVNLTNELFFKLQMRHGGYMHSAFGGLDE